jgi:hypothetical protein
MRYLRPLLLLAALLLLAPASRAADQYATDAQTTVAGTKSVIVSGPVYWLRFTNVSRPTDAACVVLFSEGGSGYGIGVVIDSAKGYVAPRSAPWLNVRVDCLSVTFEVSRRQDEPYPGAAVPPGASSNVTAAKPPWRTLWDSGLIGTTAVNSGDLDATGISEVVVVQESGGAGSAGSAILRGKSVGGAPYQLASVNGSGSNNGLPIILAGIGETMTPGVVAVWASSVPHVLTFTTPTPLGAGVMRFTIEGR